jgi:hypothetical protein
MIKPIELESADGNDVWNTRTAAGRAMPGSENGDP